MFSFLNDWGRRCTVKENQLVSLGPNWKVIGIKSQLRLLRGPYYIFQNYSFKPLESKVWTVQFMFKMSLSLNRLKLWSDDFCFQEPFIFSCLDLIVWPASTVHFYQQPSGIVQDNAKAKLLIVTNSVLLALHTVNLFRSIRFI